LLEESSFSALGFRRGFVRDIDIGIVVSREVGLMELSEVASALEQVLSTPVDLLCLTVRHHS